MSDLGQPASRDGRIRAYIRREHFRGRRLAEIMDDPAIESLGGRDAAWRALIRQPRTIAALVRDAIEAAPPGRAEPPARPR